MMSDSKAKLCIKADGPFHCFSFKSSIMPIDMSYKVGEEFEYKNPLDPTDVQKVNHNMQEIIKFFAQRIIGTLNNELFAINLFC